MKILLVTNSAWNLWNFRRSLIERLSTEGYDIICAAPADGFEWHLSEFPRVRFIPLQFLSRKSIFHFDNVRLFFEISQLMQREQPDVAMFFTIKPNVLGVLAARWNRIPAISTIEGRGISATSQHWLRALSVILYRLAFRFVHRAIFINSDDYNDFIRYRIIVPEQAVLTNGPGVDVQHFSPRSRRGRNTTFSFLFPARLLSEKGIREYAEAAAMLKKQGLNARFQVIGNTDSGNPTTISEDELQKWVGEGRVEYIGFTDDVRPAIADADVIVLPSYYREGVPRCLLEAMSMEKIILTTDNVGCRETVEDGKNGLIIPVRDAQALADAMRQLTRLSPAKRAQMGHYSRQKAIQEFSDDAVLPVFMSVIQSSIR